MKLRHAIKGRVIKVVGAAKKVQYFQESRVQPGDVEIITGFGDPPDTWREPPKGKKWVMDHHHVYWEVSEKDLDDSSTAT